MALSLYQTKTALGPSRIAYFLGSGGTGAMTYSVVAGGAGGTINATTGFYTAPATVPVNPSQSSDTIMVTDSASPTPATATATIMVGNTLDLVCDIIQHELGLASGRVFQWNGKIFQPTDQSMYVVIAVPGIKPFANTTKPKDGDWANSEQCAYLMATLDINVISRNTEASRRAPEVIMALLSQYSQAQQENNSFHIGRLPTRINDLSGIDGAAIPYRYQFSVNVQYSEKKIKADDLFDTFQEVEVVTNP